MELAESDLYDFITEENNFSDLQKMKLIIDVVETMSHVHNRDIIHRDLSPQNILMVDGEIRISDFGIGKEIGVGYTYNTLMTKNVGRYNYSAPEQLESLKIATKQADVFSLGRLINFIFTSDPLNYNHYLNTTCRRATANIPENRYNDASYLLQAIKEVNESRKNEKRENSVLSKIEMDIVDGEVLDYVMNLTLDGLEDFIESERYSTRTIITMIDENHIVIEDIILKLYNIVYNNTSLRFEIYDKYAAVAKYILTNKSFESFYDEQILAARIMKFVSTDVNRFNVQNDVEELLRLSHLDKSIKDILS